MGGPYHETFIPAPIGYTEIVLEDGKYIWHMEHYKQGECWVWHKFVR